MAENLRVLIVDPDVNYRIDLKKQLARAGIEVVGEADYGADSLSLAASTMPDCAMVSWVEPTARIEQTIESLCLLLPGAPVLAYSDIQDLASTRKAIHAGAHDYLPKPLTAKDVQDAIYKAFQQIERRRLSESEPGTTAEGLVIAVFGAKGGIGKTTLSTNLAVALRAMRGESVALLDIDTRFGDVAIVLDVNPETSIGDAVRHIEELDRSNIRSYLSQHNTGVNVLAAPTRPSDWRQVRPEHIEKLVHLLAQTHDYVILDTPGFFTELVGAALDLADIVLMMTTLDISSIKDSGMAMEMLATADFPMDRVKLVVNHPTDQKTVRREQMESVIGSPVFWDIPHDKAFIKSGQLGTPVVIAKPSSQGARRVMQLASAISGSGHENRTQRSRPQTPTQMHGPAAPVAAMVTP